MTADDAFLNHPDRACAPGKVDDPDVFFSTDADERHLAVRICRHCPFTTECDQYATDTGQQHGVWGGRIRTMSNAKVIDRKSRKKRTGPTRTELRIARDAKIAELYALGHSDLEIAVAVGVHPRTVCYSRRRQGLDPLYGPGGRMAVNA